MDKQSGAVLNGPDLTQRGFLHAAQQRRVHGEVLTPKVQRANWTICATVDARRFAGRGAYAARNAVRLYLEFSRAPPPDDFAGGDGSVMVELSENALQVLAGRFERVKLREGELETNAKVHLQVRADGLPRYEIL